LPSDTVLLVLTLTHVIEATVTRADGSPIKDASVEIWQPFPDFKMVALAKTDEEGKAWLDWAYPGEYFLLATKVIEGTQSEFVKFTVDEKGVASPSKFDLKCHGAPWFYRMTLTYDRSMTATDEQMVALWDGLKKMEISNPDLTFHNLTINGADVLIDFELKAHSLILTIAAAIALIIAAIGPHLVALGIAIAIVLIAIAIIEYYKPPAQKTKFVAPDGTEFPDQASLADYLISKADPHPWVCPYEGCNMRFSTEAEKLTHIQQFHVKEWPLVQIAAIVSLVLGGAYVLAKVL
jgi:hypothetical protein